MKRRNISRVTMAGTVETMEDNVKLTGGNEDGELSSEFDYSAHDEENPNIIENEKDDSSNKLPDLPVYISSSFPAYKGFGTGPPAGPKRYKSDDELHTPPRGRLLGEHDIFINKLYWSLRLVATVLLGLSILIVVALGYVWGLTLLENGDSRLAMGMYGAFLCGHLIIQQFFAYKAHLKSAKDIPPDNYDVVAPHSIALQISAYQEDPDYFRECIEGIMQIKYPKDKFKVLCFIDGNSEDSCYMVDIFEKVVKEYGEEPTFFWWDYNYHELPEGLNNDENGVNSLVECLANNKFVVLMQKWGGKREVMYTAFKSLQGMVDYVQVCDSDTKLDPMATIELAWILDNDPTTGAVGGDVKILNEGDSFISFLSGLRYWMAFNVERACQSYFGCVSCISGPLGLYRMSVLEQFLDLWSDQKFLGEVCTFGDDRHLTNRMLQMGYKTKYTPRSICLTETPAEYLRWLSQQIRWTKSYFREWLFNSMWWHKQSPWCVYENVVAGGFPFYVIATCITTCYSNDVWSIIFLLLTIQLIGVTKGIMAGILRRDWRMVYMSLYSSLYITSLLPAKIFAILTIRKKGWGTSGRKTMLTTYNALIPPLCWLAILVPGILHTIAVNDYEKPKEEIYLYFGSAAYILYWIVALTTYNLYVRPSLTKKSDFSEERKHQKQPLEETWHSSSSADFDVITDMRHQYLHTMSDWKLLDPVSIPAGPLLLEGIVAYLEGETVGVRLTGSSVGLGITNVAGKFECPDKGGLWALKGQLRRRLLTKLEALRLRRELANSTMSKEKKVKTTTTILENHTSSPPAVSHAVSTSNEFIGLTVDDYASVSSSKASGEDFFPSPVFNLKELKEKLVASQKKLGMSTEERLAELKGRKLLPKRRNDPPGTTREQEQFSSEPSLSDQKDFFPSPVFNLKELKEKLVASQKKLGMSTEERLAELKGRKLLPKRRNDPPGTTREQEQFSSEPSLSDQIESFLVLQESRMSHYGIWTT